MVKFWRDGFWAEGFWQDGFWQDDDSLPDTDDDAVGGSGAGAHTWWLADLANRQATAEQPQQHAPPGKTLKQHLMERFGVK